MSVGSADAWVVWTWEELGAEVVGTGIDGLARAVRRSGVARRGVRDGVVGLLVAVGARDDDLELLAPLAGVGGCGSLNAGAPESALVVGDGGWVWAPVAPDSGGSAVVGAWVQARVAFDVDVEGRAEVSGIALGGASGDVVG